MRQDIGSKAEVRMRHVPTSQVWIWLAATLGVCMAASGCAVSGNPGLAHQVVSLPQPLRDRTHLVFVESPIDIIGIGRLAATADYLRDLGFQNVSVDYYNGSELAGHIRRVRCRHPDSRIMVVGWSAGSKYVVDASEELEGEGTGIDVVVFLDSGWIKRRVREWSPSNVARCVLIYRTGHEPPLELPNSQIYEVPTYNHLAIPTMPETVDVLLTEILHMTKTPSWAPSAETVPPKTVPVARHTDQAPGYSSSM